MFDYSSLFGGLGQLGGGLAGLFGLGKGKNPADVANKYLDQIPGQSQQYYQPYQQSGMDALKKLQEQYGGLLGGDVQNKLGENYKQSPGYANALKEALGAGSNAAAAGGMLGTPVHQDDLMNRAGDVASKDYNNYLQNQLGLYGMGLQGEQGLNEQGYGANTDWANLLANINQQKAAYGYQGQNANNQAGQQNWNNIFGGLGSLFGL